MPSVSVVIPTYNHAQFLGVALASVRAQTVTDWECIVVNNFSADDTEGVVAEFGDTRIRLVNFSNHGVIAASRNHGIALSQSEFVAFLDSDDAWAPDKLQICLEKLASGFDLVCHAERWVHENGHVREVVYGPERRAAFDNLLFKGNCISTSAVVVRRDWLARAGGFDERAEFITAEDYHLWLKLAKAGARIGFVAEMLGIYRIHAGNQSRVALRNLDAAGAVFESMLSALPVTLTIRIKARRRRAILDYSGARGLMESGAHRDAAGLFARAIWRWPFSPKFYAAALLNATGGNWR